MDEMFSTGFPSSNSGHFDRKAQTSDADSATPMSNNLTNVAHVGARGAEVMLDLTRQNMGIISTAQMKSVAKKQIKTYVEQRLRMDCKAALEIHYANATTAVTLHKEGLAVMRAEVTNERRLAMDAHLAVLGQTLQDQVFQQLEVAFNSLEATEAAIEAKYPEGHPRRAQRLKIIRDQAQQWIDTIGGKLSRIMDKACHEFEEALRV